MLAALSSKLQCSKRKSDPPSAALPPDRARREARRRGHRRRTTSRMAETDFIRFVGRKSEDEQSKIAHVVVGEGDLRLRADASLLAVSNRFGALFCCTAQGLRWCWLADLHQQSLLAAKGTPPNIRSASFFYVSFG